MTRDVAITGIGVVSPFGIGRVRMAEALRHSERVAARPLPELAETRLSEQRVATFPGLAEAARRAGGKLSKYMSEQAMLTAVAGTEAAQEAELMQRYPGESVALYAGTGLTATSYDDAESMLSVCLDESGEFSCERLGQAGLERMNPLESFKLLPNMPPCILSVLLGIRGPSLVLNPWAGQAGACLLEAWRAVRGGELDAVLVGAADTPSSASTLVYLRQSGLLGLADGVSSAGCFLVLETRARAQRDRRPIHALVEHLAIRATDEPPFDPLEPRFGHTFAALAPLLVAGMCLTGERRGRAVDERGMRLDVELGEAG